MNFNINHAEILIDKMLDYYSVVTYSELANNINTTQQTISSWKQRNSVSAIKKKCKELGIYNEIFGDFNLNRNIQKIDQVSNGNNSQFNYGNQINNIITDVDGATLILLNEAYQKAKKNDDLNGLRQYLMKY